MRSRAVLITGLSGVGKSSVLGRLAARGYRTADTDDDGLSVTAPDGDWVWDLDRVAGVLDEAAEELIFVSGTASNMGGLLPRFDRVLLLSAPVEVMAERLTSRSTNPYGKGPGELEEALGYKDTVEPLLRRIATFEIDTRQPLDEVVAAVLGHVDPSPNG